MNVSHLTLFYELIRADNRISTVHISLFMALYVRWGAGGFQGPVEFKRQELMEASKISGLATYHRCIKDLDRYGYIRYLPSYHAASRSRVYIEIEALSPSPAGPGRVV